MIIADTSIWIEFFRGNEPFHSQLTELLEYGEVLAVECIFGELLQGAKNDHEREVIQSYWNHLPKAIESGYWIEAGIYSGKMGLPSKGVGLIDAFLITVSRRMKLELWTLDKKLKMESEN